MGRFGVGGEAASLKAGAKLAAALGSGQRLSPVKRSPGWCQNDEQVFESTSCRMWARPLSEEYSGGDFQAAWSGPLADGWILQGAGRLYVTQFQCTVDRDGVWYSFPYAWGVSLHVRYPYLDVHPRYGSPLRLTIDHPHRVKVLVDHLMVSVTTP